MDQNNGVPAETETTDVDEMESRVYVYEVPREGTVADNGAFFNGQRVIHLFARIVSPRFTVKDPASALGKSPVRIDDPTGFENTTQHEAYVQVGDSLYPAYVFFQGLEAFDSLLRSDLTIYSDSKLELVDVFTNVGTPILPDRAEALIAHRLGEGRARHTDGHLIKLENTLQLGLVDEVVVSRGIYNASAVKQLLRREHHLLGSAKAIVPCQQEHVTKTSIWAYNGMSIVPFLLVMAAYAVGYFAFASVHDMVAMSTTDTTFMNSVATMMVGGTILGTLPVAFLVQFRHRQVHGVTSPSLFASTWMSSMIAGFTLLIFASQAVIVLYPQRLIG